MDSIYGRRVRSCGSSSWPPRDSAAGCFVPKERDGAKRVLSQSWNGVGHAGPASEAAVWRAAVECKHQVCGEPVDSGGAGRNRSEEHTSELQSLRHLVCRLLLEKKK